jgi:hypothetical protein
MLLFGVFPIDYDDICIVEVGPGFPCPGRWRPS